MPTNLETLPAVLTVQQAARALNVSKNTAYALVRSGKLHSVRIGRQIRIPKDALIEFLQK
ncbi:MAG: helix-turn-helix domain-containing protein [Oscillospiraceae bacterium]|nr:helix-turn-helix domain-containing protein [Oscillospiraceae bacterium]